MSTYFIGYIPVLHDGYIKAFNRHPKAIIGILTNETILGQKIDYLRKDIRNLTPEIAKLAIQGLGRTAKIFGKAELELILRDNTVIMPDDDITRKIEANYPDAMIIKEPVFLRWDRDNSSEVLIIKPDREISLPNNSPIIKTLSTEAKKSSNWWRHIGCAVFDDGELLLSSHNSSVPSEYTSYIECDPRITSKRGEDIERSVDIHSELRLIAEAAKQGISLEGKDIYVSTFPCPNCAKAIALSGFRTCYFVEGYAMRDGQTILHNFGVEIIKINAELEKEDSNSLKSYPKR